MNTSVDADGRVVALDRAGHPRAYVSQCAAPGCGHVVLQPIGRYESQVGCIDHPPHTWEKP